MGAPAALQVADRWHILKNQREALERMLNRLHVDLSRLPDVAAPAGTPQSSTRPCRPRRLRAMSAAEQAAQQAARKRRLACYQQVQTLVAQGVPILQIATQLRMSRATATAFAAAATFPERAANRAQPSGIDPYLPILHQRWEEGCTNASQLWREIYAQAIPVGVAKWPAGCSSSAARRPPPHQKSTGFVHRRRAPRMRARPHPRWRHPVNSSGCFCARLHTVRRKKQRWLHGCSSILRCSLPKRWRTTFRRWCGSTNPKRLILGCRRVPTVALRNSSHLPRCRWRTLAQRAAVSQRLARDG
jgi:hypothetical protein